jgi:hypothetical protein
MCLRSILHFVMAPSPSVMAVDIDRCTELFRIEGDILSNSKYEVRGITNAVK